MSRQYLLRVATAVTLACLPDVASPIHAQTGPPSRQPVKGCVWERASDKSAGLAAWVQRCDFGTRKIHLYIRDHSLMQQYSDGGAADAVVEVFDLQPSESVQNGIQRVYLSRTARDTSARCVIASYTTGRSPVGAQRYTFVPNVAYAQVLKAKANPNEVPEPPCGAWGSAPDGIQYFQAWPTATVRKVLFVRVGQDEPLFDEQTLQILPTAGPAKKP